MTSSAKFSHNSQARSFASLQLKAMIRQAAIAATAVQREGDTESFGDYELRYHQEDQGERKPRHVITAHDQNGDQAGELNWYGTTGKIHHIGVEPGHERKGLATAMWSWGQQMRPRPKHSGDRTTQGDAWAKSVGGPIPRKKSAAAKDNPCPCCDGSGEHPLGHECAACDASGEGQGITLEDWPCEGAQRCTHVVGKWPTSRFPSSGSDRVCDEYGESYYGGRFRCKEHKDDFPHKDAAAHPLTGAYPNPTGGTAWYHGTDSQFDEGIPGGGDHWNTDLGRHYTSDHDTAKEFATGDGIHTYEPEPGSHILHADLHMSNPKQYRNERAMGHDAIDFAHSKGLHFVSPNDDEDEHRLFRNGDFGNGYKALSRTDTMGGDDFDAISDISLHGSDSHHASSLDHVDAYLGLHPKRQKITSAFREHLKSQGHDGITYGNEYEGPKGHKCAIAFDSTPVHDKGREWLHPASQHLNDNSRTASVLTDWRPQDRLFAPTKETLDPRLFTPDERIRPEVRETVLGKLGSYWSHQLGTDWQDWARVYLAGSEASLWWGNNDFDVLIGIEYSLLSRAHPALGALSPVELSTRLNAGLRTDLAGPLSFKVDGKSVGPFDATFYVNPNSWDIRRIKPYAAYDLTRDEWAVKPLVETAGHKFNESEWYYFEGVAAQIKAALKAPEPTRSRQANLLWQHVHTDRARAFGPHGAGAFDRGNVLEKFLDQAGLWQPLVDARFAEPSPESFRERMLHTRHSTAFTAEGFDHGESKEDVLQRHGHTMGGARTAALHDISQPKMFTDPWGKDPEDFQADLAQKEQAHSEFREKVRQEAGLPEGTERYKVQEVWEGGVRTGLAKGHLSIDDAEKRGFHGDSREHGEAGRLGDSPDKPRKGGYQALPDTTYHVSTNADAAAHEGLKTRSQLGQKYGHGLGGGKDDTVSLTTDHDMAHDIHHALHEYHAVLNGKVSGQQLMDYAKNPPKGEPFDRSLGLTLHPERIHEALHGTKIVHQFGTQEEFPDHKPYGADRHEIKGKVFHSQWERAATDDEKAYARSELYKAFSSHRAYMGKGHRDPMFLSNDPKAFSKADPSKFGILKLGRNGKGQGYPLRGSGAHHEGADSGEWRTHSGDAVKVDGDIERPEPRHIKEFGLNKTATGPFDEQDWSELHADLPDSIHRGIGVMLPDELHRHVHDETRPVHERAAALLHHVAGNRTGDSRRGLGTSWSGDEGTAEDFAHDNAKWLNEADHPHRVEKDDHSWGTDPDDKEIPLAKPGTAVVLHAHKPDVEDISEDTESDAGGRYNYHGHGEREVPLVSGATAHVHSISFKPTHHWMDPRSDNEKWTHHKFPETQYHEAKAQSIGFAGICIKAEDTGRVLLLQRSMEDAKDPARGTWEFPGGGTEDGETPFEGAKREFEEETGSTFPEDGYVAGNWVSKGIYQGFVVVIGAESDLDINTDPGDRTVLNPDDPDQDLIETVAWWEIDHLPKNPAVRKEVKSGTDWKLLDDAALPSKQTKAVRKLAQLQALAEGEYRMQHQPADASFGAPMHDLTSNGVYPADVYTHPHYHSSSPGEDEGHAAARRSRGKPEHEVMMYRAVPHGVKHINPGDWVTTSKDYARDHGRNLSCPGCGGDMQVLKAKIKAKHLVTSGDSLAEWGYTGTEPKETAWRAQMSCPNQHKAGEDYDEHEPGKVGPTCSCGEKIGVESGPGFDEKLKAAIRQHQRSAPRKTGIDPATASLLARLRRTAARRNTTKDSGLTSTTVKEHHGSHDHPPAREGIGSRSGLDHPRGGRQGAEPLRGRVLAGESQGSGAGAGGAGAQRSLDWHPQAAKELKKLDGPLRQKMVETVGNIAASDPATMGQTHPLNGQMKGWSATKVSRGHRIIHQTTDSGGLYVGSVGLHDYGKAIQRLTSLID